MNPHEISTSFLIATGHIRAMRGGAQSHMLTASDGHAYVVKFANNPQSLRVLANEWLACSMGGAVRLTAQSKRGCSTLLPHPFVMKHLREMTRRRTSDVASSELGTTTIPLCAREV